MNAKTPKKNQVMTINPPLKQPGFRPKFKMIVVKAHDPYTFAQKYQDAMNWFVANGWNIATAMPKGEALIITGQRLEAIVEGEEEQEIEVLPESSTDSGHVEILYSFIEKGQHKSLRLESMPQAMNLIRDHLATDQILPNQISVMSVVTYEPLKDWPMLNRMFPRQGG